jgi:hypothetical protein
MAGVEVRGGAKEAILAHLALKRARWQVRVRLTGGGSCYAGIADIAFHGRGLMGGADNLVSGETNGKCLTGQAPGAAR